MPNESESPPKPETTTIVANRGLASMIRTIADHHDITMAEALERFARPALAKEYRKVLDQMQSVLGGEG